MKEEFFYARNGGFEAAKAFEGARSAEGYLTCMIGHPNAATAIVRYWI